MTLPVQAHPFKATERVPGWCVRCGGAEFVHPHPEWTCRPETCGGIDYDPCEAAILTATVATETPSDRGVGL